MAARRKVGNLLALAVLSTLVQRPMHPYEVASILRERGKDADMQIKWGSLYTVVGNLAKHGFIEVADTQKDGARPERVVYRITDAGRAELVDWVRELIANPEPEPLRFRAGLSVFAVLGPDEAATLLRTRLHRLDEETAAMTEALSANHASGLPRLFLIEDEYLLAARTAEAAWVRALLEEFDAGTFPELDQWADWHRTGALPPELAEQAERGSTQ